ncbi:MAG: LysM peptidoglycan-binding domain-containing protein, partial [Bdellovibrionales bacterium]|nr:LysM peptidoglycan-binding domain-containing protein [Bdellovibrionales bacterium]
MRMKLYGIYLLVGFFLLLTGPYTFGKALPDAVKSMSDKEYEDYLHGIYLKQYKDPVPFEVWSSLVSSLSQPSHQLQYKDNLWDLSESYFKDHWLWSKVWVANEHISNPHRIRKGDTIRFDLKTLSAVNWKSHSVDIQKQFPNIRIPAALYQKPALSKREIPASLPNIKDRLDPSPPDAGFDLEPVPINKNALLAFYLSEEDLSGQGVVKSKDGYGLSAMNGEDVIISYDGEVVEGGIYTIFENRGSPVFSLFSFIGVNFKGYEIVVKGSVKIMGYLEGSDSLYRARVIKSLAPINPGDRVMSGHAPRYILSQKGTHGSTKGQIIGSPHKEQKYFGMYSFVYLNRGLSNGVQVGDSYHVRLNKDTEIQYPYLYDKPAVGKIRVVHANPDTSTAIVSGIRDTVKVGDFFEPSSGMSAVTDSLRDHEVIDGELDDGEGGFQDMEMDAGGTAPIDDGETGEDTGSDMSTEEGVEMDAGGTAPIDDGESGGDTGSDMNTEEGVEMDTGGTAPMNEGEAEDAVQDV